MITIEWQHRFIDLAKHISSWSKDPSSKIGAIFVDDNRRILSTGYNGFPKNIKDDNRLLDREMKYSLIVHAEQNAIYNATLNGVSLNRSHLFVYGLPICSDCAKGVIQVGTKAIYIPQNIIDNSHEKWSESWKRTMNMFEEANVEVNII